MCLDISYLILLFLISSLLSRIPDPKTLLALWKLTFNEHFNYLASVILTFLDLSEILEVLWETHKSLLKLLIFLQSVSLCIYVFYLLQLIN